MERRVFTWIAVAAAYAVVTSACAQQAPPSAAQPSDAAIKELMVRASIAAYDGTCPCPETRTSNGQLCGGNSAYRREGGKRVLCYSSDVSEEMVNKYRDLLAQN